MKIMSEINDYLIKLGDIIIFDNKHVLLCEDSTIEKNYEILLNNIELSKEKIIFYTDPPYNAGFNGRSKSFEVIINDNMNDNDFKNFISKWYECCKKKIFNYAQYIYIYI